MRRRILIVPEWLSATGPSYVDQSLEGFTRLAEGGEVFHLSPGSYGPASWLGLEPEANALPEGPLAIAAFGAEPPRRSVQFRLSLASLSDGALALSRYEPSSEELRTILGSAERLNTRAVTVVRGSGLDHGLVWEEGSIELETSQPTGVPFDYAQNLPRGDGENLLRRFIDDSVNLLGELELNRRRVDQDLPPLNCLWPWGQGFAPVLPQLALERGEPVSVFGESLLLAGLAKMVGYRPGDPASFGKGTALRLEQIDAPGGTTIGVIDAVADFRADGLMEEGVWLTREIDERLLGPWARASRESPVEIVLLAPGLEGGLGLRYATAVPAVGVTPFDERALGDSKLPSFPAWEVVKRALTPASP